MINLVRSVALIFSLLFLPSCTSASAETRAHLPLVSLIASLDHAAKESIKALPNDRQARLAFAEMVRQAAAGKENAAEMAAERAGYDVKNVTEAGRRYLVLLDAAAAVGPTVVLAQSPSRDIVIQAPHGVADRGTDIQSAIALTRLGARALILAGAHRCAALAESVCSGQTRICGGGRAPYRVTDGAHNPDTRFHAAHVVFAEAWPLATTVQLHGFGVKGTDAWVVVSDGSFEERSHDSALSASVRDAVRTYFGRKDRAVSCQDPEDKQYDYRPLCARTNVQGRYLNGSADICDASAKVASGRFLHVEQAWEIRREVRRYWDDINQSPLATVVIVALEETIPCTLAACP